MDDKVCRLEILRLLKQFYDKNPHSIVGNQQILQELPGMGMVVLERNARYLEEKGLIDVGWTHTSFNARIKAEGIDFLETGEPSGLAILSPVTVHQEFHGSVGAIAGRDINVQISFNEVLNKLTETIEANYKIPPEEKLSLIDKLKSLAGNGWIQSTGTAVLAELIKKSVGL